MAQLFTPRADTTLRTAVAVATALVVLASAGVWAFARSPAATGQYHAPAQPVPFAHPLHVNGLRIDCEYCHAGVRRSASAGLPPTSACVPCHKDATLRTRMFQPIAASVSSGRPVVWRRVTSVPDFVFFNHAVHVDAGVSCQSCHGPVERMLVVYQAAPLTMEWCLQCHRAQRSRDEVQRLTACTTCHR